VEGFVVVILGTLGELGGLDVVFPHHISCHEAAVPVYAGAISTCK